MTEEEIIKVLSYQISMKGTDVYTPINYDAIQGILDLYNKQQKEIEEEKDNFTGYKLFKDGKEVASIDLSKDGGCTPKKLKGAKNKK